MYEWMLAALLSAAPGADSLLEAADRPRRAFLNSVVRVRATTRHVDGLETVAEFDLHVGGDDRQLIVFTDPRNKGRRLLLRGDKVWLFTPGTTHPVPISANQRLAGGASYAEVARVRLAADYRATLRPNPEPCAEDERAPDAAARCQVLDLTAVARTAPYPTGTLWVEANGLVRRALYRHASGKPAKSTAHEYREQNGRAVLSRTVIVDQASGDPGPTTTVDYLGYRREPQPEGMFDPPRPADDSQSPR